MGYTTEFKGEFRFDRPLTAAHRAYLMRFTETRRMKRNASVAARMSDPLREAVGLPIGCDGEYFVGVSERDDFVSVVCGNIPPSNQCGLWCGWVPNNDGTALCWDGSEKFYRYVEWLEYLIAHFFVTWNYVLEGRVTWQGEDGDDKGTIVVHANTVRVHS